MIPNDTKYKKKINEPSPYVKKMCTAKKSYRTQNGAIKAALRSSVSFAKAMRWYHCPLCHKWHVTSQTK